MNGQPPTWQNFAKLAQEKFGNKAGAFLKLYSGKTDEEVKRAVMDYSGDEFIAFATWKWIEAQAALGKVPVYRYEFDVTMPANKGEMSMGAHHSSEIEFVSARSSPGIFPGVRRTGKLRTHDGLLE